MLGREQGMEAQVTRHRPRVAPYSPSTTYKVKTLPCTGVDIGDCLTQEEGRKAQVFAWAGTLPSSHWIPKEHCVDTWASVGLG